MWVISQIPKSEIEIDYQSYFDFKVTRIHLLYSILRLPSSSTVFCKFVVKCLWRFLWRVIIWQKFSYKVNFSIWIWSKHKINQILGMDPHPVRYKSIPAYFIANIALQFEYSSFSLFPLSHILNKHPVLKKPLYFQNTLFHPTLSRWASAEIQPTL